MTTTHGRKQFLNATEQVAARVFTVGRSRHDRFARDPFAHLEAEHVHIQDLETLAEVTLNPYPHQEELLRTWIDVDYLTRTGELRFRNVHEEKSRQMGITWIIAYACSWAVTHHSLAGLAMSLKASEIDDGGSASTTDSFFGRIRFITQLARSDPQDPLSKPAYPATLAAPLTFIGGNAPMIRNPARATYLAGTGATPDPGRGGHYGYAFIDEASRLPFARAAHRSIARACNHGRLYNSTPFGEDALFHWLKERRSRGYTFLHHHWSRHPVFGKGLHVAGAKKTCNLCAGNRADVRWEPEEPRAHRYPGKPTSPWYDEAVIDLTDEDVASELEIDYAASLTERVYAEFSEELHVAAESIPYDPMLSHKTELSIDYGAGTTSVTICQDAPREYRMIGEVELHDTQPDAVCAEIIRELRAIGVPPMLVEKEWLGRMLFVGDPAGEARQQATGRPLVAEYARHGFSISSQPTRSVATTVRAVKRLLLGRPKPLVISPRCIRAISHFKHNRWETDRLGNRKPTDKILNDDHAHMLRGVAYLVTWKFPPPTTGEALTAAVRSDRDLVGDPRTGKLDPTLSYDTDF